MSLRIFQKTAFESFSPFHERGGGPRLRHQLEFRGNRRQVDRRRLV
jgi:hypothetical protein